MTLFGIDRLLAEPQLRKPLEGKRIAILEEKDGTKSFWAIAHPPGDKPDFHDPACFAAHLP